VSPKTSKEQEIACPHCRAGLILDTPTGTILLARRICPSCEEEFLIVDDVPMTADEYRKNV
jgi:uncharacterized protein YbaR (Trm112 family)